MFIKFLCAGSLALGASVALAADEPLSRLAAPQQKSCEEVVQDYKQSCLKACETYQDARKRQCEAACTDDGQLRLRKTQCEEGRKA